MAAAQSHSASYSRSDSIASHMETGAAVADRAQASGLCQSSPMSTNVLSTERIPSRQATRSIGSPCSRMARPNHARTDSVVTSLSRSSPAWV